jgi:uridine monophosphate synthetase
MIEFDQAAYNAFLIEHKVVGFFEEPITLKSGRISNWYVNCRVLLDRLGVIDRLTDFVLDFADDKNLTGDYFYGVPEGATKLAVILNYKKGKLNNDPDQALIIGRGKPKTHGAPKDRYFIGPARKGDRAIVIEDVTTTGGSLLSTIQHLQESQIGVVCAIGLVNRMEKRDDGRSVEQAVKELDVPYLAMGNSLELLPLARDSQNPAQSVWEDVEDYFGRYGLQSLK